MAATIWDQLRDRALVAARQGIERETAARELLSTSGGDRRMVLAARLRLAAEVAERPADIEARLALAVLDRALARGDAEGLWHPVFGELDPWHFSRHHAAR
jgi:hypothetical protein